MTDSEGSSLYTSVGTANDRGVSVADEVAPTCGGPTGHVSDGDPNGQVRKRRGVTDRFRVVYGSRVGLRERTRPESQGS